MPTAARRARVLVLIVAAVMPAGGESVALPLSHLFADHHHAMGISAESGNLLWMAVHDHHDHHDHEAVLSAETRGHDHEIREPVAQCRVGSAIARSLALMPVAVLDDGAGERETSTLHRWIDPAPDIGKPDLALLATLRV